MEQVLQGVVTWAGDAKKFGNYSFKLEDQEAWFRNPNRNPEVVQAGNLIKVKAVKNKKGDFDVKGVALVQADTGTASAGEKGNSGGYSRNESIMLQHSQDVASRVVTLLVQAEAVKLAAKTKPEASKAIILDLIDELTARFYADANAPAVFLEGRSEVETEETAEEETSEPEAESGDDVDWQ